jgi:PAS domain S-box-containing protein
MPKKVVGLENKIPLCRDVFHHWTQLERDCWEQRESLRLTLNSVTDAVIIIDSNGRVRSLNPQAESLTGWRQAEAIGEPLGEVFRLAPASSAEPNENPLLQALQEPHPVRTSASSTMLRRDGVAYAISASVSPIQQPDGSRAGAVLVFRDAPDDCRMPMRTEVKEAHVRKEEFLAMLAHELRNPLAPIRSGLDLLALDQTANQETVDLMKHQVDYLVRLIDDLLDVSRIVQGKVRLRRESVELSQIVKRAVDTVNALFERRNQTLIISLPAGPAPLFADPVRLTQVLANLLHNASKFTGENGRIELFAEPEGRMMLIRVRDSGMGISRHMLTRVFELFTQAASAIDRSEAGLGIGLTLVKSLVELHSGTVTAASEGLGKGSVFTVALPLMEQPRHNESTPDALVTEKPRRILVVDDNVGAAKMLSLLLCRLGPHEVRTAHDGYSTFQLAASFRPDIIFLDIGLPTMDGFEVARRIRADSTFNHTLLVAVTGYGQDEDRQRSRDAGFDEHLVKPVDVASLRQTLNHPKLERTA